MTKQILATLVTLALLAACGKYGPPLRAGEAAGAGVSGVTVGHPADCEDPGHDHDASQEMP